MPLTKQPLVIKLTGKQPVNDMFTDEAFDAAFKPKGAMAFFVLLVILGLIIWFGIYFLMLQRM